MASDKKAIEIPALNFTWYTGLIAIVAPLGAAVAAFIVTLGDLPSEVIVGALATVAVGLLAAAIAASADVLARAWVTVARERYSIEKTGASLAVRVPSLSPNPISVITARWDATEEKTWYLVKEPGVSPVWIREDEVKGWLSQTLDS